MNDDQLFPEVIANHEQLEELLSRPRALTVELMSRLEGDIIILGAAGKMGPSISRMAKRASDEAGTTRRIIAVSRFSNPSTRKALAIDGIDTLQGDLLDRDFVDGLPDACNVIFMAGHKFGGTGREPLTWASNSYLPSLICRRYQHSRIVAFSSGNIYGLVSADGTGSCESDSPNPHGEYAMSCLGRERIFEHFSHTCGTKIAIIRLNYANELRYGVLVDLANKVWNHVPIDISMGKVNVIWQGDANSLSLQTLEHSAAPPFTINVAGSQILDVRKVCGRFGELFNRSPILEGEPAKDALLSNGQFARSIFLEPQVSSEQMIMWIATWIKQGGELFDKPTRFEVRNGKY